MDERASAQTPGSDSKPGPASNRPVTANYSHQNFVISGGVAIFHLASSRVVVCYHTGEGYWFLPKGRRDVHENSEQGAEREGFEESGYRNRLLPIPLRHRQPLPHISTESKLSHFVTQPVWMQLMHQSRTSQYLLFWYIAETVPPDVETSLNAAEKAASGVYQYPPEFPRDMSLKDRVKLEGQEYVPVKHHGTAVDEEEAMYESYLLPVDEALKKLDFDIEQDVVRKGWNAIRLRFEMEESS